MSYCLTYVIGFNIIHLTYLGPICQSINKSARVFEAYMSIVSDMTYTNMSYCLTYVIGFNINHLTYSGQICQMTWHKIHEYVILLDICYRFYVIQLTYWMTYVMLSPTWKNTCKNISYVWHVFFSCQPPDFFRNLNMTYDTPIYQPHDICHSHISYYLIYLYVICHT